MVYKKYIKRDGKVYGPYSYHSIKKDGKVITQYLGLHEDAKPKKIKKKKLISFKPRNKKSLKKFLLFGVGLVFVLGMFFLFSNLNLTGKVALSIDDVYRQGEVLEGNMNLVLEEGELIPALTKVLIEFEEVSYEYILSDLVNDNTTKGIFSIKGKDISGTGEGYAGDLVYPVVYFSLDIFGEVEEDLTPHPQDNATTPQDIVTNQTITTPETNESINQINTSQDTAINETVIEPVEEVNEIIEEVEEIVEEEPVVEEETAITGNIVKKFVGKLTGEAVLSSEVNGEVSFDKPFVYNLTEAQTATVVSSSQDVELIVEDGRATVTTDFVGEGKGILIDLSELNIPVSQGKLKVSLFYNGTKLVSASEVLDVEEIEEVVNITDVSVFAPININTTQYGAVINQPVKWKKNVKVDEEGLVKVKLPKGADKISVYKIVDEVEEVEEIVEEINETTNETEIEEPVEEINKTKEEKEKVSEKKVKVAKVTGEVALEIDLDDSSIGFFRKLFSRLTGWVVDVEEKEEFVEVTIDEFSEDYSAGHNASIEYDVEYETPGPVVFEDVRSSGKEIVVSSEISYENVFAYTELPKEVALSEIQFYHVVNGSRVAVDFVAYDVNCEVVMSNFTVSLQDIIINQTTEVINETINDINENRTVIYCGEANESEASNFSIKDVINETEVEVPISLVSYITWVVPHLSNQTYLLIIEIVGAEHLDEDRNFVSDIYEEVRALDGNWSEVIDENHYVRVVFEQELDSSRDITVYARADGKVDLEVYTGDCEGVVLIDGNNISKEIYAKKKRIDEIRRLLNE